MLGSVSFLLAEIIIHHFKTELALLQRCVHCVMFQCGEMTLSLTVEMHFYRWLSRVAFIGLGKLVLCIHKNT